MKKKLWWRKKNLIESLKKNVKFLLLTWAMFNCKILLNLLKFEKPKLSKSIFETHFLIFFVIFIRDI